SAGISPPWGSITCAARSWRPRARGSARSRSAGSLPGGPSMPFRRSASSSSPPPPSSARCSSSSAAGANGAWPSCSGSYADSRSCCCVERALAPRPRRGLPAVVRDPGVVELPYAHRHRVRVRAPAAPPFALPGGPGQAPRVARAPRVALQQPPLPRARRPRRGRAARGEIGRASCRDRGHSERGVGDFHVTGVQTCALPIFAIQGSWNYRTLIGTGFAFALLPLLRSRYRGDPARLRESLERHASLFNSHPYLAPVALGAVAQLEA